MSRNQWIACVFFASVLMAPLAHAEDAKFEHHSPTDFQFDPQRPTIWKADVAAGLVWVTGNSQSLGVTGQFLGSVRHYNNEFTLNGSGAYVSSSTSKYGAGGPLTDSSTTVQRWLVRGRYDRYFLKKNSVYVSFQSNGDAPAGFDYRLEPQIGYSRIFYLSAVQQFRGEVGYDYTREQRIPGADPAVVEYHSGRLFLFYENHINSHVAFSESLELLESFNQLESFRLNSITSLSSTIYKNISIKLNFTLNYNNSPALRPTNLVDPDTKMPFVPNADDLFFDKLDTKLDVLLAVSFF